MLTIVDDHSRKVCVYFLQHKREVKTILKQFITMIERECDTKAKVIRSDNGMEYCNQELTEYFKEKGIRHQLIVLYTPQQNGLAERTQKTMERARCMFQNSGCDQKMWAEAVNTVYLMNRSSTKKLTGTTPEEMWTGKPINLKHIRVFGCKAYAHIPCEKRAKLDPKSKSYIFTDYCEDSRRLIGSLTH